MVGLLRRLKAKIRILETVKKNRIRELKKKDKELRRLVATIKLKETLKKGDEKKEREANMKNPSGKILQKLLLSSKLVCIIHTKAFPINLSRTVSKALLVKRRNLRSSISMERTKKNRT